jgi:hypothetical protein
MEIRFTRTTEYLIELDAEDTTGLAAVDGVLQAHGVEGDNLVDRLANVHAMDPQDPIMALIESGYCECVDDSVMTDSWDADDLTAPWADTDDDDTEPLNLGAEVTGAGFVHASLT